MPETPQQYTARMLGLAGDQDPWAVLAQTPPRLQSLVGGATARELAWTTSPARWSITQIVAHLADAELVGLARPFRDRRRRHCAATVRSERVGVGVQVRERGRECIAHIMRMYTGHDLNHLGQIERLLAEAQRA